MFNDEEKAKLLADVAYIRAFVETLEIAGAQVAASKSPLSMMLRNMFPGVDELKSI